MRIKVGILSGGPSVYTAIQSHTPESLQEALEWAFRQQQYIHARRVEVIVEIDAEIVLNARRLDGTWASC